MIAPLRRRHRTLTSIVAVVVPIGFVAALAARPDWPVGNPATSGPTPSTEGGWVIDEIGLSARVVTTDAEPRLILVPDADPALPDVLVYWSPSGATGGDVPAVDARLLGKLVGDRPLELKFDGATGLPPGSLQFYSLARSELVASSLIPAEQ